VDAEPRAVRAWRQGGAGALDVLEQPWTPSTADNARARAAWERGELPEPEVWRNRWTVHDRQLRYGRDGRWYPYRATDGDWWPTGTPHRDPTAALTDTE
jgi:hypothetical protein